MSVFEAEGCVVTFNFTFFFSSNLKQTNNNCLPVKKQGNRFLPASDNPEDTDQETGE